MVHYNSSRIVRIMVRISSIMVYHIHIHCYSTILNMRVGFFSFFLVLLDIRPRPCDARTSYAILCIGTIPTVHHTMTSPTASREGLRRLALRVRFHGVYGRYIGICKIMNYCCTPTKFVKNTVGSRYSNA